MAETQNATRQKTNTDRYPQLGYNVNGTVLRVLVTMPDYTGSAWRYSWWTDRSFALLGITVFPWPLAAACCLANSNVDNGRSKDPSNSLERWTK